MTQPIDAPRALSYMVPIVYKSLNRLVSEIFSIKVADTRIDLLSETNRESLALVKTNVFRPGF